MSHGGLGASWDSVEGRCYPGIEVTGMAFTAKRPSYLELVADCSSLGGTSSAFVVTGDSDYSLLSCGQYPREVVWLSLAH